MEAKRRKKSIWHRHAIDIEDRSDAQERTYPWCTGLKFTLSMLAWAKENVQESIKNIFSNIQYELLSSYGPRAGFAGARRTK